MKRLALLTALTLSANALLAQSNDNAVIDRANQSAPAPAPAPKVGPAENDVATGTDSGDAGVQRLAETRKLPFKISASTDLQVYYTDNVLLANDSSPASNSDAIVFGATLAVNASGNPITLGEGLLTPKIGLVYQNFRHGIGSDDPSRKDLDFDSYTVPVNASYRFGEGWEATAGVSANAVYRIHGLGDYKRIIASYTPGISLSKVLPLSQEQVLVLSTGLSHSITKATLDGVPAGFVPFRNDRNDKTSLSFDASYYLIKGRWIFNPYARVAYTDYDHYEEAILLPATTANKLNRNDLTASFGLTVSYKINNWSTARVFTGYEVRDSKSKGIDYSYESYSLGLGASLTLSF